VFTATFSFAKGEWDAEFHALDNRIADAAKATPGYIGEETWENTSMGLISNVYYFETRDALEALMTHPDHLEAKAQQSRWLNGFHIVVAEVVGSYGDRRIAHPLGSRPNIPFARS
jgi:hypothetical protein